ncbi:MAG TPA: protein-disulfide reductase DsbD, partial [Gammaproteobacteria bacterium]|nr:protein-disulfide reductase DsbD [Gammaproteobacteria bacterium]
MDIRKLALYLFAVVNLFAMKPGFCDQLTADQAFALEAQVSATQRLELDWQIAPKHYLYKKQLSLMNANNESLLLENTLPSGKLIKDEVLGEYYVYEDHLSISVPLHKESANKELLLRYQGCAVDGFCYLPVNKLLKVSGDIVSVEDTTMQEFPVKYSAGNLANMLADRFLPVTLLIFFVLGVLLSFTPCVLPMIPIVVNLIVGPKKISSRKAFMLSGSYVIGMATCYTVAGIIAGMLGATLQAWLQQPFVLITLSILLVILALSQFELIHISLPHFNTRLHHWGEKQLQGSYFGAFILGILSALIVSPCITPPLIGALTYISQHGSPVIGGLALMSLGLGMGVPLIVVAMLSSMILPKAGEWMNVVKNFAGLA